MDLIKAAYEKAGKAEKAFYTLFFEPTRWDRYASMLYEQGIDIEEAKRQADLKFPEPQPEEDEWTALALYMWKCRCHLAGMLKVYKTLPDYDYALVANIEDDLGGSEKMDEWL
jgi:hypothetical protein